MRLPELAASQLHFVLPDNRIADRPLKQRDHSKLLHYIDDKIEDLHFYNLPDVLPADSLIIANNTKVIPARLVFRKETGASVEIFLIEPLTSDWSQWSVMVGNRKKFRNEDVLFLADKEGNILQATWLNREENTIHFETNSGKNFRELIFAIGAVPLPPYIKRPAEESDKQNYQTVFAARTGAVAAPTASLHFTPKVLDDLKVNGICMNFITLHVGAGTFIPVTTELVSEHKMHAESFEFDIDTIQSIITQLKQNKPIIAVGTTSMRLLESLYYLGLNVLKKITSPFSIESDVGFRSETEVTDTLTSLEALHEYMLGNGGLCAGKTAIFILPGFPFRICNALITNFHQPGSTLIALVNAFVGDKWEKIYSHALKNEYRFLSYGDSSIIWR